jgi:hypothetical protein
MNGSDTESREKEKTDMKTFYEALGTPDDNRGYRAPTERARHESQIVPVSGVSKFPGGGRVVRHCYIHLSLDGNQWCALFGSDLQQGVSGFGDTASEAVNELEAQFQTANDRPLVATMDCDWAAWIEGREEWKTGRGSTEAEAIRDLLLQIEEA